MKFEELFQPKPGSVAAEMQKTIDGLNQEIKELRAHAERVGEANDRLVVENAALRQALADMPTCRCGLSTDEQCALSVENAALRAKIAELEHLLSPKP